MTTNYKETQVAGTSWQRAVRVIVENPYNGVPSIMFVEEEVTTLANGKQINQHVANIGCSMDINNPAHIELYDKLNALYTALREARDAEQVSVPVSE